MAAYTYIAIVVGFFALAFGFGFLAGVAHERDTHWARPIVEDLNAEMASIGTHLCDSEHIRMKRADIRSARNALIHQWEQNPFIPLDLTPNDWQEPEPTADITIAIWSVRVVEETLMQDDIYFESTFHGPTNKHRIKLPKDSLALLDSIGVQYQLITEKE